MTSWTLKEPRKLAFDQVHRVVVRIVEGAASVVGSDDQPTLEVSELTGPPLRVQHEHGVLTIDYERPRRFARWPG